jgi:transposase-like protein
MKIRKKYTPEFKEQALALVNLGKPVAKVAKELEIAPNLLYTWKSQQQSMLIFWLKMIF